MALKDKLRGKHGKNWASQVDLFDPSSSRLLTIEGNSLTEDMSKAIGTSEEILQIWIYKCPLSKWQLPKLLLNHQFVVFETVTPLYLPEELKRRLCNFPAPLSDCRVFRLCEIMPAVSHALQSRNFSKCRPAWILTLCPRNHNATAHLRSHSCFFDRLVILNEDRIL